jgi:NAD(P)-dependent dehydrogenase (short-subunit alcohol dehydrogenase family)
MTQVALITGCSSGFGEAIALGLVKRNFSVVATMRSTSSASAALRASGATLRTLDVTDDASRQQTIDWTLKEFGRIDLLVNNAGISMRGSIEDTPADALRRIMETNFFAPVALTRCVLPGMRQQRSGRIVNVTAIGALLCSPFLGAYCASKHAMDAVACALDVEVRALGIRVSSVLPGLFHTAIAANTTHAPLSDHYVAVSDVLARRFKERAAVADTDLGPVVDAVVAAATDHDPKPRYLVGGGSALLLPPVLAELENIHRIELERAELS